MKIPTDFGIQEVKTKKVFEHLGHKFAIVDKECKYMNGKEPMLMRRCVEYSTGREMPFYGYNNKTTLKEIINKCIACFDDIIRRGGNMEYELSRYEKLN